MEKVILKGKPPTPDEVADLLKLTLAERRNVAKILQMIPADRLRSSRRLSSKVQRGDKTRKAAS